MIPECYLLILPLSQALYHPQHQGFEHILARIPTLVLVLLIVLLLPLES